MHHRIPNRNKPRLLTAYFYVNDSKGHRFCVGKKTFDVRMLRKCLEDGGCVKRKDFICSTDEEKINDEETLQTPQK